MKVLFHGDGDHQKGIGHLVRCLSLALESQPPIEPVFATRNPELAHQILSELKVWVTRDLKIIPLESIHSSESNAQLDQKKSQTENASAFPLKSLTSSLGFNAWSEPTAVCKALQNLAQFEGAQVIVSDGKYHWSETEIAFLKESCRLFLIDNIHPTAGLADRLIFPTDHAPMEFLKIFPQEKLRTGLEWTWVHPSVRALREKKLGKTFDLAIAMGGADPKGFTLQAIRKLIDLANLSPNSSSSSSSKLRSAPLSQSKIGIFLGKAFSYQIELESFLNQSSRLPFGVSLIKTTAGNYHEKLAQSHVALCAFGITVYECYTLEIPMLIAFHDKSAGADALVFIQRHPDAGRVIDLEKISGQELWASIRTISKECRPKPSSQIGSLAGQLQSELSAYGNLKR